MAKTEKISETAKKSQKDTAEEPKVEKKEAVKKDDKVKTTAKAGKPTSATSVAKAGKRSAKAVKAAEEKTAKEDRKKAEPAKTAEADKPKEPQKPPRSRSERAGKKYREAIKQIDKSKSYNLAEALDLAIKTATTKFDATVEVHINLAVDPKQADQNVRDSVTLPHGTGKISRVAAFVEGDEVARAQRAGADIAGSDEILAALDKEQIDFDVLVSTPAMMPRLGKYARVLGPKGLMPNPKSGTVTADVAKAVKEAKAGRVEFRVDGDGIIHLGIGKASFGPQKLLENAEMVVASVRSAKPASIKGTYIRSTYVASAMGPSIKANL